MKKKFKLFKFFSLLLFIFIFFQTFKGPEKTFLSQAEGTPTNTTNSNDDDDDDDEDEDPELESCRAAKTDFNEKHKEFTESCVEAKISRFGSSNCFKHLIKCNHCQDMDLDSTSMTDAESEAALDRFQTECVSSSDDDDDIELEPLFEDPNSLLSLETSPENIAQSILSNQPKLTSPAERKAQAVRLSTRFANCPARAAQGLEDRKRKMEDKRKEVQEFESALNEKVQDLVETKNRLTTEKARITGEAQAIEKELQEYINEINDKKNQFKSEVSNRISEAEAEILKSHQNDRELTLNESVAEDEYTEKISQLRIKCHTKALETLNKKRASLLQANVQSLNVVGSTQRLFNQAGLSTDERNRNFIRRFTQHCESDKAVKEARNAARRTLRQRRAEIAEARKRNEELRTQLQREITSLKEQLLGIEKDVLNKIMAKTEAAKVELEQKNQELKQVTEHLNHIIRLKTQDILKAHEQLKEMKDSLQTEVLYVTMAEKYNPNSIYTEDNTIGTALSKMEAAKISAYAGMNSCGCCSDEQNVEARGACSHFSNFLKSYFNLSGGTSNSTDPCKAEVPELQEEIHHTEPSTTARESP